MLATCLLLLSTALAPAQVAAQGGGRGPGAGELPTVPLAAGAVDGESLTGGTTSLAPSDQRSSADPATRLIGSVYIDVNNNGYRDLSEPAFARPVLLAASPGNYLATSDAVTGHFTVYADTGFYALTLPTVPDYYTLAQGASGYYGSLSAYGQQAGGYNFGLVAIPNQQDLRVTLSPLGPARPGRPARYRAHLENVGTTTVASGQVMVSLDPAVTIIGTVPAASQSQQQTRGWTFANLPPFAVRDYDITFSLPVTTPLGATLFSSATTDLLQSDQTPANNADLLQQTVVSVYNPNDISVNFTEVSPAQLANGISLDYLIRFENAGNDTASAVTIIDSLPASLLQLGTLQLVGSSHNCQWAISTRGVLTLRFPGIRLPFQAIDALRSQGFVRFRVRPRSSLAVGTLIPGVAHITFNADPPLTTNRVETRIGAPAAVPGLLPTGGAAWTLSPNPATGAVTLLAETQLAGRASVVVRDVRGAAVQQFDLAVKPGSVQLTLGDHHLTAGLYAVTLTLPGQSATTRRLLIQ